MKEITLKIPDTKFDFFMELIEQLGFEVEKNEGILEEHKEIVRARMHKSKNNPDRLLNWEDIQHDFRVE